MAAALGLREEPGRNITETLTAYLAAKNLLVVLDNCEHLVLACAKLAEIILRQCPSTRILATSREPLNIPGEQVWRIPSLSLPDAHQTVTPENLAACDSVRLFMDRASKASAEFALTRENAVALASVCRRLDGIPLALELAAARVRSMPLDEVNRRLDQR